MVLKRSVSILATLVLIITGTIKGYSQAKDTKSALTKDSITSSKEEKITLTNFESVLTKSRRHGRDPAMLTFKYGSNGKEEEIGSTGQKLMPYIRNCPVAVAELDSFKMEIRKERRLTRITIALMAGTLGLTFVYAAYVRTPPWVPLISEVVLGCASLIPLAVYHSPINGFDQIKRSVEAYNKWVDP
jgi:hypothetical protein